MFSNVTLGQRTYPSFVTNNVEKLSAHKRLVVDGYGKRKLVVWRGIEPRLHASEHMLPELSPQLLLTAASNVHQLPRAAEVYDSWLWTSGRFTCGYGGPQNLSPRPSCCPRAMHRRQTPVGSSMQFKVCPCS